MSLNQPDLYIAGRKMQAGKTGPNPTLAGLTLKWGTDNRLDFDPPSTLSGELLARNGIPDYLDVGVPVGLVDPISSRCLFAGTLEPVTATPEPAIAGAYRISFTASSPLAELAKHEIHAVNWPFDETAAGRRVRLLRAMPAGWGIYGPSGWDWANQTGQRWKSANWLTLMQRYVRSYVMNYADTSTFIPGAGLSKRLTLCDSRPKTDPLTAPSPTPPAGLWVKDTPAKATGVAYLPAKSVALDMPWEKTPADVITDVQLTNHGEAFLADGQTESDTFEFLMDAYVDNSALQAAYGFRQVGIDISIAPTSQALTDGAVSRIVNYWLQTKTRWRPTALSIPDSRPLNASVLLGLLAVDTRHMAVVCVPNMPENSPGPIRAYVMAGSATWTGKKWTTELTLGQPI